MAMPEIPKPLEIELDVLGKEYPGTRADILDGIRWEPVTDICIELPTVLTAAYLHGELERVP